MDSSLFSGALHLVAHGSTLLLIAIGIGALLTGILRVATQIDDSSIGFIGRFAGLSAFMFLMSNSLFQQVYQFALRIWSGSDFYH